MAISTLPACSRGSCGADHRRDLRLLLEQELRSVDAWASRMTSIEGYRRGGRGEDAERARSSPRADWVSLRM